MPTSEEKGLLPPCQDDPADAVEMPKGKTKVTSVVPEPASIGKGSPKADAASSDPKQVAWTEVTFGADVCDGVPWGGRFYTTNYELDIICSSTSSVSLVVPLMGIHALLTVKGGYSHCREDLGWLG